MLPSQETHVFGFLKQTISKFEVGKVDNIQRPFPVGSVLTAIHLILMLKTQSPDFVPLRIRAPMKVQVVAGLPPSHHQDIQHQPGQFG